MNELILLVGHPGTGKTTLVNRLREEVALTYFCHGFRGPNAGDCEKDLSDEEEESQEEIDLRNDLWVALLVEDVRDSRAVSNVILNYQAVVLQSFGLVPNSIPSTPKTGTMTPTKILLLTAGEDTIRQRMGDHSDFMIPSSEQLAEYLAHQRAICCALAEASGAPIFEISNEDGEEQAFDLVKSWIGN